MSDNCWKKNWRRVDDLFDGQNNMVKCWASVLGNCSDKQSGEHYFTKGLYKDRTVNVSGLRWLRGETKTLPLATLTVNALCRLHNSQLSPLDSVAIKALQTFEEAERLFNVRIKLKRTRIENIVRNKLNGSLFERWAAKTLVSLFCSVGKDEFWRLTKSPSIEPPENIVRAIYGESSFSPPMGLYVTHAVGESVAFLNGVGTTTLFHPEGGLCGAVITFASLEFLIWLDQNPVGVFENSYGTLFGSGNESPKYRLEKVEYKIRKTLSHTVEFEWK